MSRAIAWMAQNPVAANLLMLLLVVGGLIALPGIPQEEFPSIETDLARVSVVYRGAAPEESEQGVCIRIEEALEGLLGMDRMTSLAVEGACNVTIELIPGTDSNRAIDEIKNRVDGIDTFPVETDKPVVAKLVFTNGVVQVAVTGDLDERTLTILGREVRDEIAALPGISQVSLGFVRPYEISVEVSEAALRRHSTTFAELARAIRQSSLDMPGGSVKAGGGEILLRTKGQAYTGREFEDLVVLSRNDGTAVTLGELATIRDGFQEGELYARLDGRPAVIIDVKRTGGEDILDIAAATYAYLDQKRKELPAGVELVAFNDESEGLTARLDALGRNARSGLVLVLVTLGLFLRFRLAMWVAAGVPIAFLGAIMVFPAFDLSISTLSVMAFILVLGIVVDDAIVIGESAYSHERRGADQMSAAIRGTQDVYVPVVFGVMTTMAAFLPLMIVPGRMGRFFSVLGFTAILCLIFSLLESQLVLPAHLAHRRTESRGGSPNRWVAVWQRFQGGLGEGLERFGRDVYGRWLGRALEWRYATAAIAIGLLVLTGALLASGRLRYQFFPEVDGDVVYATLTMPRGIPVSITEDAVRHIEASAELLRTELDEGREGPSVITQVLSTVGRQQGRGGPPDLRIAVGGSHLAEVSVELLPTQQRGHTSREITRRWRELTGPVTDAVELTFTAAAFHAGDPIDVELRGGSVEALAVAAASLRHELAGYAGVYDVTDSYRAGKREVQLSVRPEARPLGLTLDDLARQVRQAFYGEEVQRVQRGQDDVRVMLRYPEEERRSLGFLEEMRIRTSDGTEVPFGMVAEASFGRGYASIRRSDRMRVVNVVAQVDRSVATPEAVLARVQTDMPRILAETPGVAWSLEGEQREHSKAMGGLMQGFVLALLLIYALLAIPLRSYSQPLIIMSVIPFGAAGALLGHLIMGWDVVFFSVLGIVALAGVVVNSSLVLVHFVNRRREAGAPVREAVADAGVMRFRPIFLTSATTYLGLVPLMFEGNVQAQMMIPMAISLGYGVLCASVVTLFLVPSLYLVLEDIARLRDRLLRRSPQALAVGGR